MGEAVTERKPGEERREEILQNALDIIHEQNHSSLTVRNIAERTSISEAGVYSHFDDKEEIVKALAHKVFESDELCCEGESFETAEEMLENMLSCLFEKLGKEPGITALIFNPEIFGEYPEVREMFREHRLKRQGDLESIIREFQEQGTISGSVSAETFSTVMSGTIMMAVREWRESGMDNSLEDRAEELASELSKILSPE